MTYAVTWSPRSAYAPRVITTEQWEDAIEVLTSLAKDPRRSEAVYMLDLNHFSDDKSKLLFIGTKTETSWEVNAVQHPL